MKQTLVLWTVKTGSSNRTAETKEPIGAVIPLRTFFVLIYFAGLERICSLLSCQ